MLPEAVAIKVVLAALGVATLDLRLRAITCVVPLLTAVVALSVSPRCAVRPWHPGTLSLASALLVGGCSARWARSTAARVVTAAASTFAEAARDRPVACGSVSTLELATQALILALHGPQLSWHLPGVCAACTAAGVCWLSCRVSNTERVDSSHVTALSGGRSASFVDEGNELAAHATLIVVIVDAGVVAVHGGAVADDARDVIVLWRHLEQQ